jgi:type II secretory pathway pseudopilin PulG
MRWDLFRNVVMSSLVFSLAMMRGRIATRPVRSCIAFTIVELLVVLMIMGIVAATAAPTFHRSLQYHRLESAARRVKLDLEQARYMARMMSEEQSLTFSSLTSPSYTLSSGTRGLKSTGQTYIVDLTDAPYELASVRIDFGGPAEITFDGFGTASVGGTIELELGEESRIVSVEQTTGQITISTH